MQDSWRVTPHKPMFLRALVRADVFKWEEKHQEAFEALKNALSAETVLVYFDPAADHEVHVDGCPLGISATLVQRSPNEDHWRVVQYATRALSERVEIFLDRAGDTGR